MFNAEVTWAGFTYREPTGQSVSAQGTRHNRQLFERLYKKRGVSTSFATVKMDSVEKRRFEFNWCQASNEEVVALLRSVSWDNVGTGIDAELAYLSRKETPVDSWTVLAPQVTQDTGGGSWPVDGQTFRCILLFQILSRFNVFTSPEHVALAKWLVGQKEGKVESSKLKPQPRTGVLLLYPTKVQIAPRKAAPGLPAIGFALVLPAEHRDAQRVAFTVRHKSEPGAVIVTVR